MVEMDAFWKAESGFYDVLESGAVTRWTVRDSYRAMFGFRRTSAVDGLLSNRLKPMRPRSSVDPRYDEGYIQG
jgi:hypothetical protein